MSRKRIALVTGASRGIGRAVAVELAQMGYHLLINYLSNDEAAQETLALVERAGGSGELMPFDTGDHEAVGRALGEWQSAHPEEHVEVLVNNAGIRRDNLMMWMPREDWNAVLNVGLEGFFNVTQALLKDMLAGKWGRVINVVSLSGFKGMPGQVNYSAAKGGVIAATKALAQEVGRKGVTVNAVAPGFIATDMTADLDEKALRKMIPMARFGQPEEVAALVAFLASEKSGYITGEVISINGGIY